MRMPRSLLALLLIPALALAQDAAGAKRPRQGALPEATGRSLHAALPKRVDLLVHTPDLPALLASAADEGLGTAQAWRTAFRAQMAAWGARTGAPEMLTEGAERLLEAADGELLVASMRTPAFDGPPRATIFAFRTSRRAAALREAFQQILDGGLIAAYPSGVQEEQVGDRAVLALTGVDGRLYVRIQDGLVALSDHPLALGLLFRGLERAAQPEDAGAMLLEVRHGLGDAAWSGWTYGKRESVSYPPASERPVTATLAYGFEPVVAVAMPTASDVPVLPDPAPEWFASLPPGGPVGRLVAISKLGRHHVMTSDAELKVGVSDAGVSSMRVDGVWVAGMGDITIESQLPKPETPPELAGGATRLGWLRAWASGRLAPPLPNIGRELFLGPLTAAAGASGDREPFLAWKATDQAGELRGPRWHGPATFLALRTLRDIATKSAPGSPPRREAQPEAPLRTGGAALPPPVAPRAGGGDEE